MAPAPATASGYRPRSYTDDLRELVEEHLEELISVWDERFRQTHGALHPRVKELFEAFVRCGDPHFGFLRLRCTNSECKEKTERIVPFSCKTRGLCPSCGQRRALAWAERMVEEVLPDVPWVQLVFTIPKLLRKGFLFDRALYGELCRAAYAATRKFFEAIGCGAERQGRPNLKKAVPAMVAAPQSFGSLANFHPHCHALCSLGLFSRDGLFHPAPEDLDFAPLEELFREEVFAAFLKHGAITEERIDLLRSWRHSGFGVNSDRRIAAGDRVELESVLQYIDRAPVSLKRLQYQGDGRVLYRGNFHPALGRDYQLLSPLEFLALLVPHIALRFECRIHTYGALSTTIRRQLGWIKKAEVPKAPEVHVLEEEESDFLKLRKRSWARLIAKVYLENPALCTSCSQQMKVISALTSPHQDEVIEKILRARGEWDPPWSRERRARGPPAEPESFSTVEQENYSQLSAECEDEFNQDPPGATDEPL